MNNTPSRSFALLTAGLLVLACGDDGSTASSSDGGTESATDGTDSGTSTSSGSSGSGSMSGTGSGSSGGGSSSGGMVTEVYINGDVRDYVADSVIPDAQISTYEDPNLSTTADAMGVYELGPFTPLSETNVVLPPNTDYWGAVIPTSIGDTSPQEVELAMISRQFVQGQIDLLMDQSPAVHDPTTAFMVVRVIQNTAIDEGPVTITVDPAPPADTYYAPTDPAGAPMLGSNDAQFGLLPVIVYYNLAPMAPGGYTITASHAVRDCAPLFPEFPTLGEHITLVDIDCPPV